VGDWRESPSHHVARLLLALGADVVAADPHVDPDRFPRGVDRVEADAAELAAADAVVLLVDHDAFDAESIVRNSRYVLDTRAWLPKAKHVERL
jgi:UDP-N-acetyl-D-mannosaminuronic acid dehydrogenase/UDP-N-acetyl-D-glucosamine dehydrogenase